jgi:hypothetical protein
MRFCAGLASFDMTSLQILAGLIQIKLREHAKRKTAPRRIAPPMLDLNQGLARRRGGLMQLNAGSSRHWEEVALDSFT